MSKIPAFIWVSPYAADDARGGWKGMQFHLLRALEARQGDSVRIAPVEAPESVWPKWASRVQKQLRVPRSYPYYSEARLSAFARVVATGLAAQPFRPVVFFGPLPFVHCRPAAPYYIYTDGAFFIHYWEYNQDHSHARKEIARITAAEAEFMRGAAGVWCSSQWVANRITKEYGLAPGRASMVGTGPNTVPSPLEPVSYEPFLVMIAGDFERKGGRLAVAAVAEARKLGAEVGIKFIGATPPPDLLALPFVEWCGWLDVRQEADRHKFAETLSRAGAQILLSRSDLTPLAIPETSSFGKATLAAAVGGIPEMIQDQETGWLIKPDASAEDIGRLIAEIFQDSTRLARIGLAARAHATAHWSWPATADRCLQDFPA